MTTLDELITNLKDPKLSAQALYKIADGKTMRFVSQTPANSNGDYTMTWEIDGKEYTTHNNLFN